MKKNVIISLVLVILILLSVVAVAVGSRPDNIDDDFYDPDLDNNLESQEGYLAQVNALVAETYPEVIIVSTTENFDKSEIETDLIEITGIKRTVVEFNQTEGEDILVVIRAVIDDNQMDDIYNKINEIEYLTSDPIEFYKTARIDINEKVEFSNLSDENKTFEYQFVDQRIDAIIGLETIEGDEVSGQLQAVFRGEVPEILMFYEITNITNSPKFVIDNITLDDFEWKEDYLYNFKGSLEEIIEEETISELLDANVQVTIEREDILVYNNINNLDLNVQDLNNEKIIEINNLDGNTHISLTEITYDEYIEIINDLEEMGLDKNQIIKEPIINYYVITEDEYIENIDEKLESLNIELININKKILFNIENINLSQTEYNYPDKIYQTWFNYPEDLDKNSFELMVQAYVTKDEILFLEMTKE